MDEGVVEVLLHIFDNLVNRIIRVAIFEHHGGEAANVVVVLGPDGREDIAPQKADDVLERRVIGAQSVR